MKNALEPNAKTRQKISQRTRDKHLVSMRSNSSAAEQEEYKPQITETAIVHHLVSQYTSLVTLDVTPTRPVERQSKDRKIAKWLPKDTANKSPQLSSTPEPVEKGNSVIVGNRDTQFYSLKKLQKVNVIEVKTQH
jgi:hypothetical protein